MDPMLAIPHQHVTFASGDEGTIRAALAAMPDGSAYGRLSILTRRGARRYRAVSGKYTITPDGRSCARIQLEEVRNPPGLEELAEMTITRLSGDSSGGKRAAFLLQRIPDGCEIARTEVTLAAM
jgi:hypothetical protein